MNELNERQKELYEFLLLASEVMPRIFINKDIICNSVKLQHYYKRKIEFTSEHNSTAYALLRQDIRALNRSDEIEKIIISSKKGYKIATKEEAAKYIERRFKRDLKSLKLDWHLKKKCGLDGQLDMELNEIKAFVGGTR